MKRLKLIGVILFLTVSSLIVLQVNAQQKEQWKAPTEASSIINPYSGDEQLTQDSKVLFGQICLVCHGKKGKGDGIGGMSLNPKPSNFTKENVQAQTDGELFWKLSNGKPPMASYSSLSEKQRWGLINYIRTFKK